MEVVSFQFMMNTCEYFKKCISYGQTGMLVMPEKFKIPLNHCHQCNLSYQIVSVVAFPCYLYHDTSACSLHGANLASGVDAAHLSGSPYTLMPFVRVSFLHFPKTCFLYCARNALIYALSVLSKKSHAFLSRFLLFHSPSSCQLSDFYHITFVLPLCVKLTSAVWMCS